MVRLFTFMAEGESPLFTRLNARHPNVILLDKADKVGVSEADLGVHASAGTVALYF